METHTGLPIPWRMLRTKLVTHTEGGVLYLSTFQDHIPGPRNAETTVVETLYRNKTSLEAIFKIIDKDHSGKPEIH